MCWVFWNSSSNLFRDFLTSSFSLVTHFSSSSFLLLYVRGVSSSALSYCFSRCFSVSSFFLIISSRKWSISGKFWRLNYSMRWGLDSLSSWKECLSNKVLGATVLSCFLSSGRCMTGCFSTPPREDRFKRGTGLRRELEDCPPIPSPFEDDSLRFTKLFVLCWLGLVHSYTLFDSSSIIEIPFGFFKAVVNPLGGCVIGADCAGSVIVN